jgi:hypothetical protein
MGLGSHRLDCIGLCGCNVWSYITKLHVLVVLGGRENYWEGNTLLISSREWRVGVKKAMTIVPCPFQSSFPVRPRLAVGHSVLLIVPVARIFQKLFAIVVCRFLQIASVSINISADFVSCIHESVMGGLLLRGIISTTLLCTIRGSSFFHISTVFRQIVL